MYMMKVISNYGNYSIKTKTDVKESRLENRLKEKIIMNVFNNTLIRKLAVKYPKSFFFIF